MRVLGIHFHRNCPENSSDEDGVSYLQAFTLLPKILEEYTTVLVALPNFTTSMGNLYTHIYIYTYVYTYVNMFIHICIYFVYVFVRMHIWDSGKCYFTPKFKKCSVTNAILPSPLNISNWQTCLGDLNLLQLGQRYTFSILFLEILSIPRTQFTLISLAQPASQVDLVKLKLGGPQQRY